MNELSYYSQLLTIHNLVQLACLIGTSVGIWLLTGKSRRTRLLGCIWGLAVQPAWFYAAWTADQWGILIVDVIFTVSYIRGILNNRSGKHE